MSRNCFFFSRIYSNVNRFKLSIYQVSHLLFLRLKKLNYPKALAFILSPTFRHNYLINLIIKNNIMSYGLMSILLFCWCSMKWFPSRKNLKMSSLKKDHCNQFYTFYILIERKSIYFSQFLRFSFHCSFLM